MCVYWSTRLFDPLGCFSLVLVKFKRSFEFIGNSKQGTNYHPHKTYKNGCCNKTTFNWSYVLPDRQTSFTARWTSQVAKNLRKTLRGCFMLFSAALTPPDVSKTRVAPVPKCLLRIEPCAVMGVIILGTVQRILVILFDYMLPLNGRTKSIIALSLFSVPDRSWQTFIRHSLVKMHTCFWSKKGITLSVTKTNLLFALLKSLHTALVLRQNVTATFFGYSNWYFPKSNRRSYYSACRTSYIESNLPFRELLRLNNVPENHESFCNSLRFLKLIKTNKCPHSSARAAEKPFA